MIRVVPVDPKTKTALHTEEVWQETTTVKGDEVFPVTADILQTHGKFKAVQATGTGTQTVVAPTDNGSLFITDLFLSSNKVNNAKITLQFTDGTTTVPIISPTVTDAPANIASSLAGRWQGWTDARIDLVVTGGTGHDITASIGYVKLPFGLPYAEWDSLR